MALRPDGTPAFVEQNELERKSSLRYGDNNLHSEDNSEPGRPTETDLAVALQLYRIQPNGPLKQQMAVDLARMLSRMYPGQTLLQTNERVKAAKKRASTKKPPRPARRRASTKRSRISTSKK